MLSQNFIPTRTPQVTELVAGTQELVAELQERLRAGESFDKPKLTEIADRSFSGTRAQDKYTSRDAYDALEIAVNKYLDSQARELLTRLTPKSFSRCGIQSKWDSVEVGFIDLLPALR